MARRGISLEINALTGIIFFIISIAMVFYYFGSQRDKKQKKVN